MRDAATKLTMARSLAARLRADILSGALPIGQRIAGEHELVSRFSVSRQTVREALRELGTEGLVISRPGPGGGAFVARPDLDRLSALLTGVGTIIAIGETFPEDDVHVAIFELESACCMLAAARADAADIKAMRRAIAEAADAPPAPQPFFDYHTAFNRALWAAAGNAPIAFIMQAFFLALRGTVPIIQDVAKFGAYRDFLRSNHSAVVDAIEAGDGAGAVDHMRTNLAFWRTHHVRPHR